jgi:hypothetical protein
VTDADGQPVPDVEMDWSDDIPAHIALVEGTASLERDGRAEAAEESTPLLAGDRLRTAGGRVEVLFADDSALDLDQSTSVDLLDDSLIRLQQGRMALTIARGAGPVSYRVDGAGGTALIQAAGEYRLAMTSGSTGAAELRLAVIRGSGELSSPYGRTLVRAGYEAATTAETAPSLPYTTSVAAGDAFDRWVDAQYDYRIGDSRSAEYLPDDLRGYGGTFDQYGSWEYAQPYGYVWYPSVDINWRPYYNGRWSFFGSFGWMWVGGGAWSWPTHHYGRWGLSSGRWFWIPGRTWGPAWVSWASAPGYVSWCPLGFDNRPVFAVSAIYASSARRGWTVVSSRAFSTSRFSVRAQAVTGSRLAFSPGTRFATYRTAPVQPRTVRTSVRVLRSPTAPSRSGARAARVAPPRSSSAPAVIRGGQREIAPRQTYAPADGRQAPMVRSRSGAERADSREVMPRARSRAADPPSAPRYQPTRPGPASRAPIVHRGTPPEADAPMPPARAREAAPRANTPSYGRGPDEAPAAGPSRPWAGSSRSPQSDPRGGRRAAPRDNPAPRVSPAPRSESEPRVAPQDHAPAHDSPRVDPPRRGREAAPSRPAASSEGGHERSRGGGGQGSGGASGGGHARHR